MAEVTHGVGTKKLETSVSTPIVIDSGVIFAVGTAPVHMTGGSTNKVTMLSTYEEAVESFGYSEKWNEYSLCELFYTAFKLYGVSPIYVVNVLDPLKHKTEAQAEEFTVKDNMVKLPLEAIENSVEIENKSLGEDYGIVYTGTECVIEFLDGTTGTVSVKFAKIDPSQVKKADIIGGLDITTHKAAGLELIDEVFPRYVVAPDLILCPNWSHDAEVAAVMTAKAENINGVFDAHAIIDVDTSTATYYTDVPSWKKEKNITRPEQLLVWPKLKMEDKVFNYSTQLAGLIATVDMDEDYGDGTPCESASNKPLQTDSMVLASGEEVVLDLQKANYLNDNGIITGLNFYNGFVSWGNYTAAFPSSTDPVDYFYCISRMFKWVAKTVTLTYWRYTDRSIKRRIIDAILQGVNDWLNGLTTEEKILGGRVELREDENTQTALMSGRAKFHIFITPPSPLQEIEFVMEYDVSYLSNLLAA